MSNWFTKVASTLVGGAIVVGGLSLLGKSLASAEDRPDEASSPSLPEDPELAQNKRRLSIQRAGMLSLLGWSAANIGVGAYGWATGEGRVKYLHQMNVFWNGVNAVIGGLGYAAAANEDPEGLDHVETVEKTRSIQQILALNAGLDVAYVAGGAWLRQRGTHRDDPRLVGYGESIMIQGAFLFAFDAVLWALHQDALGDYKATLHPSSAGRPGATLSIDFW